ncbi:cyclase family protein [candidate division KSB1 bacterium]|nr:cyclase family protein [candidate division KSB1 bacterium]NIT72298.1 cyclase family protein [candidate division KSB1 bacterium]NIX71978.1 hypothetical protein [candidate division KSB1 bacterium]
MDLSKPLDISIPLMFDGEQPNTYGVPRATAQVYEDENFIGDTRRGGSCNFEEYKLIPHCNGTHTECVGHISLERISIGSVLRDDFIPVSLVTVNPVSARETTDSYIPTKNDDDTLITAKSLSAALSQTSKEFLTGLILRTLPNDRSKLSRNYLEHPPPYFSVEAMQYLVELGVQHLLVDMPSVDRAFDEGKLTAHHIFWNVPYESHDVDRNHCSPNTITEMIFVSEELEDGSYLLNLQIPNFVADAAPGRPLIYAVETG